MGYPSWPQLAQNALSAATVESAGKPLRELNRAMQRGDFPRVFEEAEIILGGPRLLQVLSSGLRSSLPSGEIYQFLARWPVPVYLTTNYDDVIQKHLTAIGEPYITYSNTEDHMSALVSDLSGAIFKLHGDLRSEEGLVLTESQVREIGTGPALQYWRTKMTSVFQMKPLIIVGHSLTDPNIRHVLAAAKLGAGVALPVCWLAPDVRPDDVRHFLEDYRIRVVSYSNQDGRHQNLLRLLESISDFIPPRTAIRIRPDISRIIQPPLGENAAAPGFFVFNRMLVQSDYHEKRIEIINAIIQAALPVLAKLDSFTLQEALELAGWPRGHTLSVDVQAAVIKSATESSLVEMSGERLRLASGAERKVGDTGRAFEHTRQRFIQAIQIRLRRDYPALKSEVVEQISQDIERSLAGYFREGGLSLATALFGREKGPGSKVVAPGSIVKFVNEASAKYGTLLERQAFSTVSVNAFIHAENAEREYLGRIAQGFFGFHSLGVFGDAAVERLRQIQSTVWVIDSSFQIPALSKGALANGVFLDSLRRLRQAEVRLFSTEGLFEETREHYWFASKVISESGPTSKEVLAAALGHLPYRKSNVFLEGFTRWQTEGNPPDWALYSFQLFGRYPPTNDDIKKALLKIGIEVIAFQDWPGYEKSDSQAKTEYAARIIRLVEERATDAGDDSADVLYKKAAPEAEVLVIVREERRGRYYILSKDGDPSPAWFISNTSILNAVDRQDYRVTWQPLAFMEFASTVGPVDSANAASAAFETVLWTIAQSGISLLDEASINRVFGGMVDQVTLSISEQRELFQAAIGEKYGDPQSVLERVPVMYRPLAAIQLASEAAQAEASRADSADKRASTAEVRLKALEKELKGVQHLRRKLESRRHRRKRRR